jgi:hypothetical protein
VDKTFGNDQLSRDVRAMLLFKGISTPPQTLTNMLRHLGDQVDVDRVGFEEEASAKRRRMHFDEQVRIITSQGGENTGKRSAVPLLIPMPRNPSYADRRRAFGDCLLSARPREKTDVKLSRQDQ